MSVESSSQTAAEQAAAKAQEAAEKAKETVDHVAHDAGDAVHRVADHLKAGAENVKDAVNEKLHRGAAEAERTRRDVAGDELSPSDRAASVANEVKSRAQAEIDALKQSARKI
jgi:hypothetical protein